MNEHRVIALEHGDGGALTGQFIRDEILSRFNNDILDKLDDASRCPVPSGDIMVTTDSFIVDPPVFSGGDIGKLAISGTINDLLATGARPLYLTLSMIISEGTPIELVQKVLDSSQAISSKCNVKIVAGDTKVLPRQSGIKCFIINTSGIGIPIVSGRSFSVNNVQNGDSIIITGTIASHALAVLSAREGLGFCSKITSDCAPLTEIIIPLVEKFDGIHAMRDPTRGGLNGVLHDMTESSSVGILIDHSKIPIQKETCFGCEMLGLDPMNLVNEGKMVIAAKKEQAHQIIDFLHGFELGAEAAIIGYANGSLDQFGKLIMHINGSDRIIIRSYGTGIPRLC